MENILATQRKRGEVSDETEAVYRYGYILLMEVCINILLAVLLGVILHEIVIVVLFNLFFVPLRGFCGGWHATKTWVCSIVSSMVLVLSVLVGKYELIRYATYLWIAGVVIACFMIIYCSPMDSAAKPLSNSEVTCYKKVIYIILLVETAYFAVMLCLGAYKYASIICCVFYIQSISLLLSYCYNLLMIFRNRK